MKNVSIIVPVYKTEKYVEECVSSLTEQSYENIEIILIDDGSPDKSGEICDKLAEKDVRIKVVHKVNGGVSSARNEGIKHSTGDYIMFADSDDFLDTMAVEKLLQMHDTDCDIVIFGAYDFINGEKKSTWTYENKVVNASDFLKNYFDYRTKMDTNSPFNKLYLKNIIDENKIEFSTQFKVGEDMLFNLEYYEKCKKIQIVDYYAYFYRIHSGSVMTSYKSNLFHQLKYLYFYEKNIVKEYGGNNDNSMYTSLYYTLYGSLSNQLKSEAAFSEKLEEIRRIIKDKDLLEDIKNYKSKSMAVKLLLLSIKTGSTFLVYKTVDFINKKITKGE